LELKRAQKEWMCKVNNVMTEAITQTNRSIRPTATAAAWKIVERLSSLEVVAVNQSGFAEP
jgi:hypothetical protein